METAIQKATEGGYSLDKFFPPHLTESHTRLEIAVAVLKEQILLDPLFWQSLGKQQGWKELWEFGMFTDITDKKRTGWIWVEARNPRYIWTISRGQESWAPNVVKMEEAWLHHWHRFIDHLAEGGEIDEFFKELLK